MAKKDLLYYIEPKHQNKADLTAILAQHPEVKFVSMVSIDFAGNDTDEKIPVHCFIDDLDNMLNGFAAQTDGSSVVLTGIATLNDARVDMIIDKTVKWFVDYNYEYFSEENGLMVGTLRIPCYLIHNGKRVDSRSILADTLDYVKKEMMELFAKHPHVPGLEHIDCSQIDKLVFTSATELEFWVKTPHEVAPLEALSSSQVMQEQYWQRTRGNVRTALEQAVETLDLYGLQAEMGHKEVGGVKGQLDASGHMTHVMEQLEIDWRFAEGVQVADNELLARIVVKEIFRMNGLEVSYLAKPIPGVAGSGEHTHMGMAAVMKDGSFVNLFSPTDMTKEFMSAIGYGALMGMLKNYEVCNPIVSCTNDSLNRLKPGFEAPICIVTSLGLSPDNPSRNRTILCGLIRDLDNPKATRFEMRSPNPYTNTYLIIAAMYLCALDGIRAVLEAGKSLKELEQEISKQAGEEGFYLEKDRQYRTESDVFEDFTAEEREQLFGEHPATVWHNMLNFDKYPEKLEVLTQGNIFKPEYIRSFRDGALIRWKTELLSKIIPSYHNQVVSMKQLHNPATCTDSDLAMWSKIQKLRFRLAKDSFEEKSIITAIRQALNDNDYAEAADLKLELSGTMDELLSLYNLYRSNMID